MVDFLPSRPESEEVSLTLVDEGITVDRWTSYEFAAHVEVPADGWSFTIGAQQLPEKLRNTLEEGINKGLRVGSHLQLRVNNIVQSEGYLDKITVRSSRTGGTEYTFDGRDKLAQAVDACADPTKTFKEGATLAEVLKELFGPFGWSKDDDFDIDNAANRNAKTGIRGIRFTKGGKRKGPRPIKSIVLHQLHPYQREGVYAFAARIAERHGLRIWATADSKKLIVGQPDFDVEPIYELRRDYVGTTNVLDGEVAFDIMHQPTMIIADGVSGGGEFSARSRMKSKMVNTAVYTDDPEFVKTWGRFPEASVVLGHSFATPVKVPRHRPLFLHDEESHTQAQLDNFVRREMAKLQKDSIRASYTVEGHGQITPAGFVPWVVDTTVEVQDAIAGLNERMYVAGRTFYKSRTGGTKTRLELIRLHTIELGEPENPKSAPVAKTDGEIVRERRDLLLDEFPGR